MTQAQTMPHGGVRKAAKANGSEAALTKDRGLPEFGRRLTDKILGAFNHAYGAGQREIAAVLRQALEVAEHHRRAAWPDNGGTDALAQADLWVGFVEARDLYIDASEAADPDPLALDDALRRMKDAYKAWSQA